MQFSFVNVTAIIFSLCVKINCRNSSLINSELVLKVEPITRRERSLINEYDNGSVEMMTKTRPVVTEIAENKVEMSAEPVKLNMKQGITMNQILSVYSLTDVSNKQCKNHSIAFANGLRAFEPWALKMFDSSSKLQSGILLGNLIEYGSYQQCMEINVDNIYGPIRGKHCKLKIIPSMNLIKKILSYRNISSKRFEKVYIFVQNATFDWSVCIPESCDTEDVLNHFEKIVYSLSEGLEIKITLTDNDCYTKTEDKPFTRLEWAVIIGFGLYIIFIVLCTIMDIYLTAEEASENKLVLIFSIWRNSKQIFSNSQKDTSLNCVHGIRFLSTCYVIIGHRYLMMMFFPVINSLQIMNWVLYYRSTAITGGTLCVDSFFMISGMLVSVGYFNHIKASGNMNWLIFYLYRYLRITPPLALVVLWYSTLIQHFGSGPLWNEMLSIIQKPCQDYWWATILHIQNYVHPYPLCMTQTWYLTCDMQYFFLSPLILIPFSKGSVIGGLVYFTIYISSMALSFYFAWINKYSGGVPITNQLFATKYFQYHYITPHTRASTYVIGMGLGYIIYKTQNTKIKMSYPTVIIGWTSCIIIMLASLVGCHSFHTEESEYNRMESSIYLSCSRSAWTLGIVWIVWASIKGYGGPINWVLSHYIFQVLGKISYGMYLLHMQIQYLISGARKQPGYFSDFDAYHYITPHTRASTYVIGMGLGYIIYKTQNTKIKMSYPTVIIGWTSCIIIMLASLVGCHSFHTEESEYNRMESSIYLSCSRSAWTLGIVWIVWASIKGYGGPINWVLSHYIFQVLGKISYGMYLLHMQIQYLISGARKQPGYFSDFDALYSSFGDLFIMVLIGFVFTVCFESPLIKLLSIFFLAGHAKKRIIPKTIKDVLPIKEKLFTVT